MWSFSIKKALVGLLTSFLIAGFFLQPLGYTGKVQTAEAGPYGLEITQIGNAAINSVSAVASVASAGFDALIDLKEFELDAIAFYIAKIFVQSITRSLINWINSGLQATESKLCDYLILQRGL